MLELKAIVILLFTFMSVTSCSNFLTHVQVLHYFVKLAPLHIISEIAIMNGGLKLRIYPLID